MPAKTVVLCTVALTPELLGDATPRLKRFADAGAVVPLGGVTPAVTATVQSTYLTGLPPSGHGAVGNGWLFRDTMEVRLWQQSNRLVQAPKVWEAAPDISCANLCWWFAMYSSADVTVTPRPMYPADGRKIPDCYTKPGDLRDRLQAELGQFPLFRFWGPAASIESTNWIAAAAKQVDAQFDPTLSLIYLPHLDYALQKKGPAIDGIRTELGELDAVAGDLIDFYEARGARVIVLSEYGIVPVSRPVHPNRVLRSAGLISYRMELGREVLDIGGSEAFAMADHQLAHVYVRDPARIARGEGAAGGRAGRRRGARRGRQARVRARPRPLRRAGADRRARLVVHLLLLGGRRQGAGLRAHGRHPPQAGLRPGRAVPGPGDPRAAAGDRLAASCARSSGSAR